MPSRARSPICPLTTGQQDRSMFEALRQFVSDLTAGHKDHGRFDDDDYRVAAAALLVHAAMVDGVISELERSKLHSVKANTQQNTCTLIF